MRIIIASIIVLIIGIVVIEIEKACFQPVTTFGHWMLIYVQGCLAQMVFVVAFDNE